MTQPLFLVTGASGWLGKRVVLALTQGNAEMGDTGRGGARVRAFVPTGADVRELIGLGAEIVHGDIRDDAAVRAFVAGGAGGNLLHLAGVIHPTGGIGEFDAINHQGSMRLIREAEDAGVKRAVIMSSNSPFGANPSRDHLFDEQSPYRPYMGYGRSKQRLEQAVFDRIAAGSPLEMTLIRAPWFYGPGQPPRQSTFFTMIKNGRFPLMGKGLNRRSMANVDSLALGILLAAGHPAAPGKAYWIADERPYPMIEVIETVKRVLGEDFAMKVSPRNLHVPALIADIARLGDGVLQGLGLYQQELHVLSEMNLDIACSIERAKTELGYRPLTDLREGMRRSVAWCIENGIEI